jgi:hypothetical protein
MTWHLRARGRVVHKPSSGAQTFKMKAEDPERD